VILNLGFLFGGLHDHPYYHVNPDILSLVSDPLPGNGCGSPNYTCISLFLFVNLLIIYYLVQRKGVLHKVESKSRFIQITRSLALTTLLYAPTVLPRLPASVIGCQPLSRLNFSPYHPSHLSLTVPEHTLPA